MHGSMFVFQVPGWPISPMKTPIKAQAATKNAFINMTFPEEEEDEDYDPLKDNVSVKVMNR